MNKGIQPRQACARAALLLVAMVCAPVLAGAGSVTLFDRTFVRQTGEPKTDTFDVPSPPGTYVLRVETNGVASAVITVNGAAVIGPSDFDNNVRRIERNVRFEAQNRVTVQLRGQPGGTLRLFFVAEDATPPTITATVDPPANAAGWHRADARVVFACMDAFGIASCPQPVLVTNEGGGQVITGQAIDRAGNVASASVTINLDRTAPTIVPSTAPPANANGWHNADVTVTFACADALSGVGSCTPARTVSTEGAQQIEGQVTDLAGNSASTAAAVSIDKTAPRITATLSAPPNAAGWHTAPVVVTFACDDTGSGIDTCPSPVTVSGEGANQVIAGVAHDRAGNSTGTSVTVSVDTVAPIVRTIVAPPAVDGWHAGDVTVSFECADAGSGVVECPAPRVVSAEGAGQPVTATVSDRAGNTTKASAAVSIDRTAPAIQAVVAPAANADGWHGTPATVSFLCTDALSGVAECPAPVVVDQQVVGRTVTGTVRDRAGNTATASATVNLDLTPPVIRAIASTAGVSNGSVTVRFECEDAESGIAVCPSPVVLSTEGLDQKVEGEARDKAGNTAHASLTVSIDLSKPTIIANVSPASQNGWHNGPVVVSFTCGDSGGAGVVSCPEPITVSTEGAGQDVSGTARDAAGNEATATVTLTIDRTPPVVRAVPSATDWTRTDVSVVFECEDTLSGVQGCPAALTVGAEGERSVSGTATDLAGNTATASAVVRIDRTAPAIAAVLDREPNAAGWHNAPVTATFSCTDESSGVIECPAAITVGTEGAAQSLTRTVSDRAGNTGSVTLTFNIDTTPPVVEATGAAGWTNTDAVITFACSDELSGVESCPPQQTVTAEGITQVEGTARDRAGNSATARVSVSIDRTAPTITAHLSDAPNAAGWHRAAVTVTFECADEGSSVATCPAPVTVSTDGAGQRVSGAAIDAAGNRATAEVALNIDSTPPVIQPALSPSTPWANTDVQVSFACSDATSGIATCAPATLVTAEGANQHIEGRAVDQAGNEAVAIARVNIDRTAPTIAGTVSPAPNAKGWHRADPTVTFECNDNASGVAECSEPQVVTQEGHGRIVTGTVRDAAGNVATTTVAVNLDKTAPVVSVIAPADGTVLKTSPVAVSGNFSDALSGASLVTCSGQPAGLTGGLFACEAVLTRGAQQITVAAVDEAGNTGTSVITLTFDPNNAPIARPGGPYNGETEAAVAFNGSASSDPDGQAITYAWDFGDGQSATVASPTHTYAVVGAYTVRLTVRDPEGATHAATTTAVIVRANRAPVASAGGPYTADIGVPVSFDASASSDPDSDVLSYAWDFGDGGSGTGQRPRRTYLSAGTFTATVTVTDGRGGSHVAPAQVTIRAANQNPIANVGGPYSGTAAQPVSFSGAGSSDPDDDPIAYAWTFGDGGTASRRDATHTYAAAGSFNVSLTVTDHRGGSHSSSTTITVAAANATPIARAGGPYSGRTGRSITFDGSQSSDPDNDVLTYSWSFGDGRSLTGAQPAHAYDNAGTFTVTLTVDDGRGGVSNATASVTVTDATPEDNRAPVANAGGPYSGETGIPVAFNGAASSDPDGDALQYSWNFGDGSTATGPTPVHTFAQANTYNVTLTVLDGRGGSHVSVAPAVIATQADRTAPVVQLSGPAQVLPGTEATVTATALDNIGVASVIFDVQGAQSSTTTTPPYQRTITVPAVAAPGDTIIVKATAKDTAGNSGIATRSLSITSAPDTTLPAVTVSAPQQTAPGATLRVVAGAIDASGIASVTFRINGQSIPGGTAPYSATYQVPQDAASGSSIVVVAEATDFAGNRGTGQATVSVAATGDVTPPTVSVVAPPATRAGADISLGAHADDQGGVAGVTIVVNGVPSASFAAPPYQTTYHVPENAVAGMLLQVAARAVDFAGLESSAATSVQVVGEGVGDGVVTGEVYDDSTGLPIANATIALVGETGTQTTSDSRGRFVLRGASGDALVRITKSGYTAVDRAASFQAGQAVELFDARLTPLASTTRSIAPVLGGSLETNGVSVAVPAGAVTTSTSLTLTRVSGQGLQGLLPAGWTPVASFDIAPAGVTFAVPAVTSASRNGVAASTPLVLATWDAPRSGWRAAGNTVAGPGAAILQAPIDASGQYAWLKADEAPAVPPAPVTGELVAGVPVPQVPDGVQATVNPQPKVIFYQPGVRSDVVGTVKVPTALSSGTRMWSRLTESYAFFSKAEIHPEPFTQDLVFYQSPDDALSMMAAYPVTPSMTFEALTLERGVISAELLAPPEGTPGVSFIDANGGQVTLATGERLNVAAGLTTTPIAAQVSLLGAGGIGAPLPSTLEFVGALSVSLAGGTLSASAELSIPRPEGIANGTQILLARADTVQGETKLVLVGLGRVDADRIVSIAQLPQNHVALEGVRVGGRYLFVRPAAPVGFVAGQVLGPQGSLFAGAQVSTDTLPLVSLSRAPGGYVAAATIGAVKLTALDLQKADTGFAQATLAAAGDEIAMDLRLVSQPPRVVSVTPAHGARNVAPSDPIVIVFSEPVDPVSIACHVRLMKGDALTDITSGLTANNTTLTLRPAQPLAADSAFTLTVEKVKDGSGYEMAAAVVTEFFTVDTTAPAPPPAGSISATIPENGTTTVRGTQGTAGAHDTVTIENLTRGTSTPVLLDPNGGFLVLVQAAAIDVLKLKIVDPSGNETLVNVPRFTRTNADGSVTASVTSDGGRVEGPGGVAVDIDPGTFPAGAMVTIKPLAEGDLPLQLTTEQKELFGFSGGLQLDFGGVEPQKYVDVSVAATPDDTAKDQWVVAQVVTVNGYETFNLVDMAALEAGRITTASPPCPGVTGQGVYGIYKSKRDVGLNYGEIYHNDVNGGLRLDIEPVFVGIGAFALPFPVIVMNQRQPVCMPVLSGNVSISENQLELKIDPDQVTPADRSIVVVNSAVNPAAKYSFPRNILEYAFRVEGSEDDPIDVIVEKIDGSQVTLTSQEIASIRKDAGANTVTIRLNMDKLTVTPKKFIIRNNSENPPKQTIFEQSVSTITLRVAAAPGNTLAVSAIDAENVERPIQFTAGGATYPTGNLALHAVSGTIDPPVGQAPAGLGVKELWLGDENSTPSTGQGSPVCGYAVCMPIDLSLLDHGALVFPFQGDRSHRYGLHVIYEDGRRDYVAIPGYRLIVTSTQTGRVIRRITAQAPPRGAPANLGLITDDELRPVLTEGPARFDAFDPSQPLTFTFSEAIDELTAKRLILLDSSNQQIAIASVIISPDGRTVTFVPTVSLKLGETYTLNFGDVTDLAQNKVLGAPITLKTFEPRRLCMNDSGCQAIDTGAMDFTMVRGADQRVQGSGGYTLELEPIADLDFLRTRDRQDRLHTNLFLTLGGYGIDYRISAIDVTDPRKPSEMGRDFGGKGKRRMTLIPGLQNFRIAPQFTPGMQNSPYIFPANPNDDPCPVPNQLFTGDIAVLSSFQPEMSFVTFYNVTDPWKPCVLGDKLLTASPFALNDFNRKNTIHASGFARGVAAITHDAGISIFTAVGEVGVTLTDLAENIPSRYPDARLKDELYAGDVIDLEPFRDRLIIARRDTKTFEVLDANMTPVASIDLPQRPVRLVTAEAYQFDANGDGQITQDEVKDLAFVATDSCSWNSGDGTPCSGQLQVIDISNLGAPSIIGVYKMPGFTLSMDLDAGRQRLVVGTALWQQVGGGHSLFMVDLSKPDEVAAPDADNDGWDDRIVWRHDYRVARPDAVRIDTDRGLAYVGVAYYTSTMKERGALDIWALFDDCCDLAVDFTAEADEHETGDDVTERELRALRAGIKKGLDDAASCGISTSGLAMLEQGSGACIWRGDCDGTYQPGISDHDYEVFFPQIAADSADPGGAVRCVIDQLNDVFKDHKPVKFTNRLGREDQMSFDDVTFYPVSMGELTRGRLGIHPPVAAGGSDPGGDLGMGRQQLLLKWLLEGDYVHGVGGYNLKGQDLEWVLQLLRRSPAGNSPTGVPLLEGYEWARLMEYNLAKAKTYIRIKGASETTSSFHDFYVKQLHDAGKFGLRAALARVVAASAENERAIANISRVTYRSPAGCLDMKPNVASGAWQGKPCGSFEEYVASAAGRSPLFSEGERQLVARFYRVKSDRETIPNEAAADAFIAATHGFVQAVKTETYPVYAQTIQQDPLVVKRLQNLAALVGGVIEPAGIGGKLAKELKQASLKLAPRFFNQGFRNADEVLTVMYRDVVSAGTGSQVKALRVSLAGGESRFVKSIGAGAGVPFSPVTEVDRNQNDISDIDVDSKEYYFVLGAGTGPNPYIDQTAGFNQLKNVVFTIDLPSHSGESGHKVQEAERHNNYNGFHYYILDRQSPANAPSAQPIPLPLAQFVLDPDPSCFTEPQIRVVSQNVSYVNNQLLLNLWNTSTEPLFDVQVCSDLAGTCELVGTVNAQQAIEVPVSFNPPSQAGTYGSNITVYARTLRGQNVALRWNNTITSAGSPFDVRAYDNTKLNALGHPFSRWTLQHDAMGNDVPLAGVIADGTGRAVKIRIDKLKPGVPVIIRLLDADTRTVEDGTGRLDAGNLGGSEVTLTPDLTGSVELFYTPPAVFVRPGMAHQNDDFNKVERGVRLSVVQDEVGVTNADLALRRPPVFLAHGLFGDIHVWKDFSPLVPGIPAQYYVPRSGFDGRFDLFVVGTPHLSQRFKVGAEQLKADIGYSLQNYLPRYALGKVDVVGHSLGGVLSRKLTNDDPVVRESIRKLILINSPQGGSPVADRMVEAREKLPLKVEGLPSQEPPDPNAPTKAAIDLLDIDPEKVSSLNPVKVKVEWCSAVLHSLGRSGLFNVFNGGVDDLQTALVDKNGARTEIGKIVFGEWEVPTHHIVTTTTQNDFGFSTEVTALWTGLGLMCNMTPDETTLEKTNLLKISAEAIKTIAPLFKGATATRTLHKRPFGSLESKKILVDTFKGTLKKGLEELFIGEDPTIVFTTSNDRVVPVWSQLGDGVDETLPPGPLNPGHPAVTEVFGQADHQSAKITPGVFPLMCTHIDPQSGLLSFDKRVEDLNGDGKPDPTCRVMDLLEADPTSNTFIKTGGQQ